METKIDRAQRHYEERMKRRQRGIKKSGWRKPEFLLPALPSRNLKEYIDDQKYIY